MRYDFWWSLPCLDQKYHGCNQYPINHHKFLVLSTVFIHPKKPQKNPASHSIQGGTWNMVELPDLSRHVLPGLRLFWTFLCIWTGWKMLENRCCFSWEQLIDWSYNWMWISWCLSLIWPWKIVEFSASQVWWPQNNMAWKHAVKLSHQ